jgi:hypothetical protein
MSKSIFCAFITVSCFAVFHATVPAAAPAAQWTAKDLPGSGTNSPLLGISCPSESLCVAVGDGDRIASSSNPSGGASAWNIVEPGQIGDSSDNQYQPDPSNYRTIRGISCPTPGLCIAVTFDGFVYSSTDPTGGDGAWRVTDIDGKGRDTHLMSVSCPSPSLCVAVSGDRYTAGKILSSTNPTAGPVAWFVVQLDETLDLRGVSCPSPSLCVAVAENGRMVVSTDPTGGAAAWRDIGAPAGPGNLQAVSCIAVHLCVAGNASGNLLTSKDPAAGAGTWSSTDGGGSVQITGISCLSTMRCIAVDNNGDVLASVDPTGGRSAWSFENVIPYVKPGQFDQPYNAMFGISCPSASFCAVVAANSRIFTSTDPWVSRPGGPMAGKRLRRPKRPKARIAHVDRSHYYTPTNWDTVRFRFFARGQVRRFLCSIDGRAYRQCKSPKKYRVHVGRHVFRVRAVGTTGLEGPIAIQQFTILHSPGVKHPTN